MIFYNEFCRELNITPENNSIRLKEYSVLSNTTIQSDYKIFQEDRNGNVDILVYTIDRNTILIDHPQANPSKPVSYNTKDVLMHLKRLKESREYVDDKGEVSSIKYEFPKGSGSFPFFPPLLVDKYEKGEEIDTLILTEGYKKAWYAAQFGVPVVGLSSITHYKNKDTQAMYEDVIKIINKCKVKNVIMLYDGDCFAISTKALDSGKDIYTRPFGFYNACLTVRELFKDYSVDVYFGCVNSETVEGSPNGLDDIFIAKKGMEQELVHDLLSLSCRQIYFKKENITQSVNKFSRLFNFDVNLFYRTHSEVIQNREFLYRGTKYIFDEIKNELKIIIPAEAKNYFRVGDDFYKNILVPNKYNQLEKQYHKRNSGTIRMDHGSKFFEHIAKYETFCNVPSHTNYSQVIHNCFNLYCNIEIQPEEGNCDLTLNFVRHIFGDQYEFGLDYIQLLYQQPTQVLPILCLVSKENKTGKSTFIKWVKSLFGQNATIIGNDLLNSSFNGSWGSKLLICCEESFIEKMATVEKIKALATGDKIQMEKKGQEALEIDFFGKFILASNQEENFIYANKEDIRYWVIKVPKIAEENVKLNYQLIEEMPSFFNYLNNRTMSTENKSRMWFKENLIFTESLRKLINANRPKIEKTILLKIKELFIDTGREVLELPLKYIKEEFLKSSKDDDNYLRKIIEDNMSVHRYQNQEGKYDSKNSRLPYYDVNGMVIYRNERCRPYIFKRNAFLSAEDLEKYEISKAFEVS